MSVAAIDVNLNIDWLRVTVWQMSICYLNPALPVTCKEEISDQRKRETPRSYPFNHMQNYISLQKVAKNQ